MLISSAGPEEAAWDLGADGTLLTNGLLNVINGIDVVNGDQPGAIYLSDLMRHIQRQVAEQVEVRALPTQNPVLVGYQDADPLLFVHRRLTFEQISLKTVRYSSESLRVVFRRVTLTAVVLILFGAGTAWTVSDHLEFLRTEQGHLVLYQGHPHIHLPGLPRPLWIFDINREALRPASPLLREQGTIVGDFNQPAAVKLNSEVKPEFRWFVAGLVGQMQSAYGLLVRQLADGWIPPFWSISAATFTIHHFKRQQDIPLFSRMSNNSDNTVSLIGLTSIAHFGQLPNVNLVNRRDTFGTVVGAARDIVAQGLEPPCNESKREYLLAPASIHLGSPRVVDALLRLDCRVSAQDILRLRLTLSSSPAGMPLPDRLDDLTMLAAIGPQTEYRSLLKQTIDMFSAQADDFGLLQALSSLGDLPKGECDQSWTRFLASPNVNIRFGAAYLLAKTCGWSLAQIEPYVQLSDYGLMKVANVVKVDAGLQLVRKRLRPTRDPLEELLPSIQVAVCAGSNETICKIRISSILRHRKL